MPKRFTHRQMVTALAGALAEWLFAALPLIVVIIVAANFQRLDQVLQSPEWAFGAAVLAGQALIRFIAGFARSGETPLERVLFGAALLLIGTAVPAYIVLGQVVSTEYREEHLPMLLIVFQGVLFVISSLVFILVSAAASLWSHAAASVPGQLHTPSYSRTNHPV
jgi:hypothetical protein